MVIEPPVLSSSSSPPSGDPSPNVSSEASQPTRYIDLWQFILPSVFPLTTRSPLEEPFDINWQPQDTWFGFGNAQDFPPLTSEQYLLATALLSTTRSMIN